MTNCGCVKELRSLSEQEWATVSFEAVLDRKYLEDMPLISVYAAILKDLSKTSQVVKKLNEVLPIPTLQHLKRVKRVGDSVMVIVDVCESRGEPREKRARLDMLQLWKDRGLDFAQFGMKEYVVVEVVESGPCTRQQYEKAMNLWPVNFHPLKEIEALISSKNVFDVEEFKFHVANMKTIVMEAVERGKNMALVADGTVCLVRGWDLATEHPLQHATMVAVDAVARLQHGGAWSLPYDKLIIMNEAPAREELPYLCTGFDLYVLTEPCVMCAMSAVHSRVRRVFFWLSNTADGALVSRCLLHTIKDLNHHFQVFQMKC